MYNIGQTAVFLKDLTGREYPAIAEVNRKKRVNGQRELSLSFLYTEINKDFMGKLEFGWKVLFKGEWYTITHPGYSTDGDFFAIDVTAILSFFVDLNGFYLQDKVENKSMTPAAYFTELFSGTPYSFVLVDSLLANTLSYEDNQSKTERFLYGVDRFNAEYKVQGKLAYIHEQIGSDKDVILHEDLNVNSVKIDVDASGFHTWAKGYGDLPEEGENGQEPEYQLEVEYRSPLIDKYGEIEGPAIKDGNYKLADALTAAVKNQVENSYIISTEIETVDLTNNGYPEMVFEEGDRVWLYVSKLNLNQQVRVMEVDEHFDWEGNIIDAKYVVGNEGIASRYKSQQYDTIKDFKDIVDGRKRIGYDWLPDAIKRAAEIINGNQDSLFKYGAGEIIGINQSNPNGYMRFNTDGIGFSRDGGKTYKTAITYEGINADYVVAGTLRGILVEGVEIQGSTFVSALDSKTYTKIENAFVESRGTHTRTFRGVTTTSDIKLRHENGYIRARNDSMDWSLYFSDFGISTYADGEGNNDASGSLIFRDQTYSEAYSIMMHSHYGVVALRSEENRVILDSKLTANIESREAGIYMRPFKENRNGSNVFYYYVKMNDATSDTDGVLYYGSEDLGYGAGVRFNKDARNPRIYATDGSGDIGSGDFYARDLYGDLMTKVDNLYAKVSSSGEFRVTDTKGYNDGFPSYRDLAAKDVRANSIRLNQFDGASNFYIGTSTGEVRITNNLLYNGGDIGYKPIRASSFETSSSIQYKTNVEDLSVSGLEVINNLVVKQFLFKEDVNNGVYYNWQVGFIAELSPEIATHDQKSINSSKLSGYQTRAIQELSTENTELKQRVSGLEIVAGELSTENDSLIQQLDELTKRIENLEMAV